MKKFLLVLVLAFLLIPRDAKAEATKIDMGLFKCTAYCPCYSCSENFGRKTATPGVHARSNHTIAVDPSVIDLGSKVKIGNQTYIAEDTGGAVVGDTIDIFFDTHEEVEEFGVKYKHVWVIKDKKSKKRSKKHE